MKICPKCKKQYENGNFCTDCENDDGSPIRLEEDKISCPKCKRTYEKGTKFCSECGVRLGKGGQPSVEGMSIGDKNVIAGDVNMIGKKETYKVGGNATIVHNEDETKQTAKCHICGSIVQRINGYDCPDCGQFTCAECFDTNWKKCEDCTRETIQQREQQYRNKVIEFLKNDNKLDNNELKELNKLENQLNIDSFRASEIQYEEKEKLHVEAEFTTIEKGQFEKATHLLYDEWKTSDALNLVEQIYRSHPKKEEILELYIQLLADEDPDEAKQIIDDLEIDILWAYLTNAIIAIREEDLAKAERCLTSADTMWKNNELVKSHMVVYWIAVYKKLKNVQWLKKAETIIKSFGKANNPLELSWQLKAQLMVQEENGKKQFEIDRNFCKQKNIYYGLLTRDFLLTQDEQRLKNIEIEQQKKEEAERKERERQAKELAEKQEREREAEKQRLAKEDEEKNRKLKEEEEYRRKEEQEKLKKIEESERKLQDEMSMVYVEGGGLELGMNNLKYSVKLNSFYIFKYQLTKRVWETITNSIPYSAEGADFPVRCNWYNAVSFCNLLSEAHGFTPCYTISKTKDPNNRNESDEIKWTVKCNFKANGYRLPTSAEWEYAAKGGQHSQKYQYAGSNKIDEVGWYNYNSGDSVHEVGQKKANEIGLYDMSGNVWEWCWDWSNSKTRTPTNAEKGNNPTGCKSGESRIIRGGDYQSNNFNDGCLTGEREQKSPTKPYGAGLRLVRSSL